MAELKTLPIPFSPDLVDAIKALPHRREVRHCGTTFAVSPFDIYVACPDCGQKIKVRSYSASPELEDLFDAVFEWMLQEDGAELARMRQESIRADFDE